MITFTILGGLALVVISGGMMTFWAIRILFLALPIIVAGLCLYALLA